MNSYRSGTSAIALSSLLAGLIASPAAAQDVETFDAPTGVGHLFTAAGADITETGRVSTGAWLTYSDDALVRRNANGDINGNIIEQMTTVHLLAAYGITDGLELGVALPFGFVEGRDIDILGGANGGAAGDMRFSPRYRILGGDDGDGFRLAASLDFTVPTGDGTKGYGSESLSLAPVFAADMGLGMVRIVANLGFRYRPETEKLSNVEIGNEVIYALGGQIDFGESPYAALVEVHGVAPAGSVEDTAASAPLELLAGLRAHTIDGHAATLGAGYGLIDGYGAPGLRIMAGYTYSPAADTCQVCGAPPPAAPVDSDGDGLLDPMDACPQQPEDKDGFEDGNGCPDPDNDQDGILDGVDQCPDEAEDKDGDADEDGCPDAEADKDGDGITDAQDQCPDDPEDKDGFEDENGCPDPDNDQDGVLDAADKCPLKPETANGFEDADGCPDEKPVVQVTCKAIELGDNIYFETGRYVIQERSFSLLDNIARTLNDNPSIRKVRIDGHTDNQGEAAANEKLSTQRVWVVREYLIEKGVAKARLAYKGYGQTKPIASNDTDEGRAQNRRVEITILDADAREGCE